MGVGGFFSSNLFSLYNIVQNTQILFPKELLISTLREYFAQDTKYHYVKDPWGFPFTPDHTDLLPNAGTDDDLSTRIYVGSESRLDVAFYPCVLVKHTGSSFAPVSFNNESQGIQYDYRLYVDELGRQFNVQVPVGFIYAGAWDLTFSIDVMTEGPQDRATIVEAICMLFQVIARDDLTRAGLFIKSVKTDSETSELYQNDLIFKQTINLECRGEWRRLVPVRDIIETISMCIEFGNIEQNLPDPNLQINYQFTLDDLIANAEPM